MSGRSNSRGWKRGEPADYPPPSSYRGGLPAQLAAQVAARVAARLVVFPIAPVVTVVIVFESRP